MIRDLNTISCANEGETFPTHLTRRNFFPEKRIESEKNKELPKVTNLIKIFQFVT